MPKSDSSEELSLTFGTPESAADIAAVSSMLNALVVLVDESKKGFAPHDNVTMRVRPLQEGSLEIPIEIVVAGVTTLFSFNPAISSILTTIKQYLEVRKLLKGRPAEEAQKGSGIDIGGITIVGNDNIINVIQSPRVASAVNQAFADTEKDKTITHVEIKNKTTGEEIARIEREEFRYFIESDEPEEEEEDPPQDRMRGIRTPLTIKSPVFQGRAKWKFTYEGNTISADIKDEGFLQRVRSRAETFAAGDRLIVDLEIGEKFNSSISDYERSGKYTVSKVHGHVQPKRASKQNDLF